MKKIVLLLLALSFFMVDAQSTKRKTTKRKKAKTVKKATAKPVDTTAVATPAAGATTDAATTTADANEVPDEPISSTSILNAKSPASFRKWRDMNFIKKGDSMISTRIAPVKYGFIEDKDVVKSMVVWEIIDMNDKINQPFYHNEDGLVTQNKSLYQVLFDAIDRGQIREVYDDELFTTRLSVDAIKERLKHEVITDNGINIINEKGKMTDEERKENTFIYETTSDKVKLIKIKGMWYIDKRDGQMKYRPLGIAAMGQDPSTMGQYGPDGKPLADKNELIDLFWVWYPDARDILANAVAFNSRNRSSDISFDDLLNARRFTSIIYKVDNGLGDGVIKDYIPHDAEGQLEESDRIKDQILQMENDMWNY